MVTPTKHTCSQSWYGHTCKQLAIGNDETKKTETLLPVSEYPIQTSPCSKDTQFAEIFSLTQVDVTETLPRIRRALQHVTENYLNQHASL
jgi:hypothetical protein